MGQRFFHLVHQHQAQVARLQARQGVVYGDELAVDLGHVAGARRALQALEAGLRPIVEGLDRVLPRGEAGRV